MTPKIKNARPRAPALLSPSYVDLGAELDDAVRRDPTILYLPLAPKSTNDPARGEVKLALTVHNNEPLPVQLIDLTVSFIADRDMTPTTVPQVDVDGNDIDGLRSHMPSG